jgi:hypothetical protein
LPFALQPVSRIVAHGNAGKWIGGGAVRHVVGGIRKARRENIGDSITWWVKGLLVDSVQRSAVNHGRCIIHSGYLHL